MRSGVAATRAATHRRPALRGLIRSVSALSTLAEPPRATSNRSGDGVTDVRLGHVEEAILRELRRTGGPVPRVLLLGVVYASSRRVRPTARPGWRHGNDRQVPPGRLRENAESTLSRALRSLERKGLIVRTKNRPTKQRLISLTHGPAPPAWERDARADEAFATRCDAMSAELAHLGRRARDRAARLRMERRSVAAGRQRDRDVARCAHLMTADLGRAEAPDSDTRT